MQVFQDQVRFESSTEFLQVPIRRPTKLLGTSPIIFGLEFWKANANGTIVNFREGAEGQRLHILGDGATTVANNTSIKRASGIGSVLAIDTVYVFTMYDNVWYEDADVSGGGGGGVVMSVSGTANRITVGGTAANPVVDIAPTYVGQTSITTLGTITTGVWNGSIILPQYLGTGVRDTTKFLRDDGTWQNVPSSGGETNTASNLGAGTGVYGTKVGVDLRFKSLVAGAGVTLSSTANEITITSTASGGGEVNTASNLGSGTGVYGTKVGADLRFKSLIAGTGISITNTANDITINSTITAGEVNTASNLGSGTGVWVSKVGVDLRFKSLIAGTNVTLSNTANDITINATGGGSTSPGGSDSHVQYNNSSAFGGDAKFTFNDTTGAVTISSNAANGVVLFDMYSNHATAAYGMKLRTLGSQVSSDRYALSVKTADDSKRSFTVYSDDYVTQIGPTPPAVQWYTAGSAPAAASGGTNTYTRFNRLLITSYSDDSGLVMVSNTTLDSTYTGGSSQQSNIGMVGANSQGKIRMNMITNSSDGGWRFYTNIRQDWSQADTNRGSIKWGTDSACRFFGFHYTKPGDSSYSSSSSWGDDGVNRDFELFIAPGGNKTTNWGNGQYVEIFTVKVNKGIDLATQSSSSYDYAQVKTALRINPGSGGSPGSTEYFGSLINSSDKRLKKNIKTLNNAKYFIKNIRPVSFDWKNIEKKEHQDLGFIAQEVEQFLPGLVITNPHTKLKSLNTPQLIPILWAAVQELLAEKEKKRNVD